MDGERRALEEKYEALLRELASVGQQLQRQRRRGDGVPHYSEIEHSAHEMGRRLSRAIQREALVGTAADAGDSAPCPACGRSCQLAFQRRTIESVDGPTEICEPVGRCDRCERSFFPSAGSTRAG
jgi:hypothetical protein